MSYCISCWWKILVFLNFFIKQTKQIVWIISLQFTASFSNHFSQVISKSSGDHEARFYHCRVGLYQLVFLRSGKYFRKSSKMIHRSLTYDIVRVVVFACPLISIDKKSIARPNSPKYFRVDKLTSFYLKN